MWSVEPLGAGLTSSSHHGAPASPRPPRPPSPARRGGRTGALLPLSAPTRGSGDVGRPRSGGAPPFGEAEGPRRSGKRGLGGEVLKGSAVRAHPAARRGRSPAQQAP